jgi:hypothetical protein
MGLLLLLLHTKWRRVVPATARPIYSLGNSPFSFYQRRFEQSGRKISVSIRNLNPSSHSQAELLWLLLLLLTLVIITFIFYVTPDAKFRITFRGVGGPQGTRNRSTSQEIPSLICNPEIRHSVHKILPFDPTMNLLNFVYILTPPFSMTHLNICFPYTP